MNTMKAIVYTEYGTPDVLRIQELEKPVPEDNEVLIKIYAATVSSEDCTFRKGRPFVARSATGLLKPKLNTLGSYLSGKIEAVGKSVTRFKVGDQVFGATGAEFGAHAEYICLSEEGALVLKPANLNHGEAVSVCSGGLTALPFLRNAGKIQSGQKVLINGASGSVGSAAVQLARYFGAEVTGVCSSANVELVKSLGADKVIDYTKEDFTQGGETYDIIFDTVGKSSFSRCKGSLKPGGIYLLTVLTWPILWQMLWTAKIGNKRATITFTGLRSDNEKREDLNFLKELAKSGKVKPVIDKSYSLEQAVEAHRYVDTGHKKGNVVLKLEE
jgi:NADPH:quinone reductase-like Zn-dependent oxidoreductase